MEIIRQQWKTAAGKSLKEMTKDEFARLRVVYHGTSNPADIDKLLAQGVKMSNVPNNIGRQRFERGEYAEYQPGAGVGRGLYVTSSAYTASDYGRHVVAIEVVDADLAVPPESTVPGGSVAEALKDYNGAMIVRDIPASKVHLVAKGLTHYITEDVWETAQKVGSSGGTIYRGYKIDFPRDVVTQIEALTAGPMEESEIDQHLKLGPILVRWMEQHHWESGVKLGRHWTTRREMAETAAWQGASQGFGLILEATYRPEDVNDELTHTTKGWAATENEVNLKPGARVTITGVYLIDTYGWDKKRNLIASPIQATAARGEFIRGVTGQVSRDVAQSIVNALNGGDKAQAGKLVCDWFASSQGGYNDSGGIGSWWGPGDVRNQIVYYAEGGNLYVDPSGQFAFPSYGKTSLGILLHGTPDGDKEPGGFQFHGDVQIDSVEIYHRVGDEFSSKSSWVSCPVGKRYPMGR